MSGPAAPMPRCSAALAPSTTAGYWAVASLSQVPDATVAPTTSGRSVRAARVAIPPDWAWGMRSVRYTFASAILLVAETNSTGPIRPTMATASSGRVASSPKRVLPGPAVSRLVPSASSSRFSWARLEVEMPTTATIAAMPIAMPSAESTTRKGRARSPCPPTRNTSRGLNRPGRSAVITSPPPSGRRPPDRPAWTPGGAGTPRPGARA